MHVSEESIKFSKKRRHIIKKASIEKLPFKDNKFDLVTCLEVIYHKQVKEDTKALKEMFRVLKKGGALLIRVPAFKILYGEHDIAVQGKRRYSKEELKRKIKKAVFKIKKISYLSAPLFPLALLQKTLGEKSKNNPKSDLESTPKYLNEILTKLLSFESFIIKHVNLPIGVSLISIAKKT